MSPLSKSLRHDLNRCLLISYAFPYFQGGNMQNEVCDQEDELVCPLAVFEPPDPTRRPMYCKGKVSLFKVFWSDRKLYVEEWFSHITCLENKTLEFCLSGLVSPPLCFKMLHIWFLQVYTGGTEFSFEELRANEYLKGNRLTRYKEGKNININSHRSVIF